MTRPPTSATGVPGASTPSAPAAATQTLPLVPRAIADGIVTMPGSGCCAVLEVGGVNLALLHPDELAGLASAYHGFLAGLSFPVQLLVRVQPADPAPYLGWYYAQTARRAATDPGLRWLVARHAAHVARLVSATAPVAHRFYMVVPAPAAAPTQATATRLHRASAMVLRRLPRRHRHRTDDHSSAVGPAGAQTLVEALAERCGLVAAALAAAGVAVHRLDDDALAALWYGCLCPANAAVQPLAPETDLAALHPLAVLAAGPGPSTAEGAQSARTKPP